MESASTAMQATISCDMTCPWEFHTSHRLGPNMSITCKKANTAQWGVWIRLAAAWSSAICT